MVSVGETSQFGEWRATVTSEDPATGRTTNQSVHGTPQSVAAFLRSVADQIAPVVRPPNHRGL